VKTFFPPKRDFRALSIKDLLEAREAYHLHLAHLENVVATAIGLYRIRRKDPDTNVEAAKDPRKWRQRTDYVPARTLQNSEIEKWSWPCLLVFVDKWLQQEEIVRQNPDQVVPRFLYMPDGRVVPTCPVLAEKSKLAQPPLRNLTFSDQLIGGGYPTFTDDQQQQHVGSLGCLVTDGDAVYALTNRHVTGEEGRPIYSMLRGEKIKIGVSAKPRTEQRSQLGKRFFRDVYPGWPGARTYANLDAGLIRVDDVNYWTAQVFGVGEIDDPVDLHTDSISLDLIGCPVRAFGGASGELTGEIQALFYRYKSIGGFEYVADLLIGPREDQAPVKTLPGDSGTLWFFDPSLAAKNEADEARIKESLKREDGRARRLRPLAVQWGGQTVINDEGEGSLQFALATCLSTICRELDVDVIPDWNIGHSEYWGKMGHYKIAAKACELIKDTTPAMKKLKKLLMNNVGVIGFSDEAIKDGQLKKIDANQFVPLADVPDLAWRASRKLDSSNHFADMDEEGTGEFAGKTLLELCQKAENVNIDVWNRFYESIEMKPKDRGALPFRVWQLYKQMVEFVRQKKIAEFICAGGVMSHYVGDACQPLHVSRLHHGRPGHPEEEEVHSVYETKMLDRFAIDVIAGVNADIKNKKGAADVVGGHEAAVSVVKLMRKITDNLPPLEVIEAYNAESGTARLPHMWDTLKQRTTRNIAEGCLRLASLWASAWAEGGGNKILSSKLGAVDRDALKTLYDNKEFLPAYRLNDPRYAAELA
jgi:hypothetical protein